MIDTSDGLAGDVAQLASASGVRVRIALDQLPLEQGVAQVASTLGVEPWRLAAGASDDYELCFTCAAAEREGVERALAEAAGEAATWIGSVIEGPPGASLLTRDGAEVALDGFEHSW
jgi:thiamine-monophosphate kinase